MSMLSLQVDGLREMAVKLGVNGVCTDDLPELCVILREAADTIESLRDRLQENYGQVPEQGELKNEGKRESCGEVCGDDRFELIGKAKSKLLEATNIEMRPDEMAVIDSVLFRCWQMGWLDQLREANSCAECAEGMGRYDKSRWFQLFGTPERAARTIANNCQYHGSFDCSYGCMADGTVCGCGDYDALLEWMRGDA